MFTQKDTIVIIGRSTFLDQPEVAENIKYVQYKFHCIGINQAAIKYRTEYVAFTDTDLCLLYNYIHPKTKVISTLINASDRFEGDFYPSDSLPLNGPPFVNNTYAFYGFTHDICVSWAYMKGFKNVVLLGVADFDSDQHANTLKDTPNHSDKFHFSNVCKNASINFLDNLQPYLNIYTLNPLSALSVERLKFSDLFKIS